MQLTKHPTYLPTSAASFIVTHQLHAFDGHPSVSEKRPVVPPAPHTLAALLSEQTGLGKKDPVTSSLRSASRNGWFWSLPMHTIPPFSSLDAHSFVRIGLPSTPKKPLFVVVS